MSTASPAWVSKALSTNYAAIQASVADKSMLPLVEPGPKKTLRLKNVFGCGHYGCVAETGSPGVVFKITSDPAEATFVASSLAMKDETIGIVRYYAITQLLGSLRGRPIWAIWREAALDVGAVFKIDLGFATKKDEDPYQSRIEREAYRRLMSFKIVATAMRETIMRAKSPEATLRTGFEAWKRGKYDIEDVDNVTRREYSSRGDIDEFSRAKRRFKGPDFVGWCLEALRVTAEMMENEPFATEVGGALAFYLDHGIVLADVHVGNVGRVPREGYRQPVVVITDPGHMIALPGAKIVVPPPPAA